MNLYKVVLRGLKSNSIAVSYGESYVVAENPDAAYKQVRKYLDQRNYGLAWERALSAIHLVAEATTTYPDCGTLLFVPEQEKITNA